jgi:hypothetical protein
MDHRKSASGIALMRTRGRSLIAVLRHMDALFGVREADITSAWVIV